MKVFTSDKMLGHTGIMYHILYILFHKFGQIFENFGLGENCMPNREYILIPRGILDSEDLFVLQV